MLVCVRLLTRLAAGGRHTAARLDSQPAEEVGDARDIQSTRMISPRFPAVSLPEYRSAGATLSRFSQRLNASAMRQA